MLRWSLLIGVSFALVAAGGLTAQDGPQLIGFDEAPPVQSATPAAEPVLLPVADPHSGPVLTAPLDGTPVPVAEYVLPLYSAVVYRNLKKVHPAAMPVVVAVKHPCLDKKDCPSEYVNVQICLPPCDCSAVVVKKCESKVIYRYGRYAVEITSKNGKVIVAYHRHLV